MENIFLKVLNMSITAGWLVLAVLVLRLLLRKAPKAFAVALWALVGLRLLLPFSVESSVSLVPSSETVPPTILYEKHPTIHSGIPAVNSAVNPVISQSLSPNMGDSVNPMQVITFVAANIWVLGMVIMLCYLLISYLRLRWQVRESVKLRDNIRLCDRVASPFILGIIRPRIYLPSTLNETEQDYVIAHELAHLKRKDHWWKPLGYLLLCVHWFNPLLWAGYILLCRDIELACDEKVIRRLGSDAKKPYCETLLRCSVKRSRIAACPLAFGEVGVKQRIKGILNYRKPALWILIVAVLATTALAVCFLTDPKDEPKSPTASTEATDPQFSQEPSTPMTHYNPVTVAKLRQKYPRYFDLNTDEGLELYVWQMAEHHYAWGLLPGKNSIYPITELMDLHLDPATTEEMRVIVGSYGLTKEEVTVIPFHMPISSYYYEITEDYRRQVEAMFWQEKLIEPVDEGPYTIRYDIDTDGVVEECSLGPGPTSGLFTFTITVTDAGEPEYFNIFCSEFYDLSFEAADGKLKLRGKTQGDNPEVRYFEVSVKDGNVCVVDIDHVLSYWGEQGVDSPWFPKDWGIDEAIDQALRDWYTPDEADGLIHVQSYRTLSCNTASGTPTAEGGGNVSVYTLHLMVMDCCYRTNLTPPELISADLTPAVMVLEQTGDKSYRLLSYEDSTVNPEILEQFPGHLASKAKQTYLYDMDLRAQCQRKADQLTWDTQTEQELLQGLQIWMGDKLLAETKPEKERMNDLKMKAEQKQQAELAAEQQSVSS